MLARIKMISMAAQPAVTSFLVLVLPGGLILLAVVWCYKRWRVANVTQLAE